MCRKPPFGRIRSSESSQPLVPSDVSMTRIEPTIYTYFLRIMVHVLGPEVPTLRTFVLARTVGWLPCSANFAGRVV